MFLKKWAADHHIIGNVKEEPFQAVGTVLRVVVGKVVLFYMQSIIKNVHKVGAIELYDDYPQVGQVDQQRLVHSLTTGFSTVAGFVTGMFAAV